jgi:hypothetical protein
MEIYSIMEMISYHHKMAKIIFHHYPTMRKSSNCHQMLLIIFDRHKKLESTFSQHLWWWSFSILSFHKQRGQFFLPSNLTNVIFGRYLIVETIFGCCLAKEITYDHHPTVKMFLVIIPREVTSILLQMIAKKYKYKVQLIREKIL